MCQCIPENAEASTIAQAPPSRQTLSSTVEAPPAVQPSVPSSGPNSNPLDLLPQVTAACASVHSTIYMYNKWTSLSSTIYRACPFFILMLVRTSLICGL